MDANYQLLLKHVTEAIGTDMNLGIQYGGLSRLCTPWLLGQSADGRHVLHVFQWGGMTRDGAITHPSRGVWRWLYLDKFEGLSSGRGPVHPALQPLEKADDAEWKKPAFIQTVIALRQR